MVSEAYTKYYETATLAKTVQQQQGLFAINNDSYHSILSVPAFLKIFRLNYFQTIYKICLLKKAASLNPLISLIGF